MAGILGKKYRSQEVGGLGGGVAEDGDELTDQDSSLNGTQLGVCARVDVGHDWVGAQSSVDLVVERSHFSFIRLVDALDVVGLVSPVSELLRRGRDHDRIGIVVIEPPRELNEHLRDADVEPPS